jgi:hypothetical protein
MAPDRTVLHLIKNNYGVFLPILGARAGCTPPPLNPPLVYYRPSSLGLIHIHRDFEVDLYKAMEVFVSAKTRREHF